MGASTDFQAYLYLGAYKEVSLEDWVVNWVLVA